jgi:hypothetical protein
VLVPWVYGGVVLALLFREKTSAKAWSPLLILLATLGWLLFRENELAGSSWWLTGWLVFGWGYFAWLAKDAAKELRVAATGLLWVSLLAVSFMVTDWFGDEWHSPVFLLVALGWVAIGGFYKLTSLAFSSLWPALVAAGAMGYESIFGGSDLVFALNLILVIAWWWVGWRDQEKFDGVKTMDFLRTLFLGVVIAIALGFWLDREGYIFAMMLTGSVALLGWRYLRSEGLSWLGAIFALGAVTMLIGLADDVGVHPACVVAVAVLAAADGVWLARPVCRLGPLANPRVASVFWGGAAMVTVLAGFGLAGVAEWTTAVWATGAVALLVWGFWVGLRGYRVIALLGLAVTIVRLFLVDIDNSLWRIIAFGVTGALLVGIGYLYNRFHKRLADGDLDWGKR